MQVPDLQTISSLEAGMLSIWPANRHMEYRRAFALVQQQLSTLITQTASAMSPFHLSIPRSAARSGYAPLPNVRFMPMFFSSYRNLLHRLRGHSAACNACGPADWPGPRSRLS